MGCRIGFWSTGRRNSLRDTVTIRGETYSSQIDGGPGLTQKPIMVLRYVSIGYCVVIDVVIVIVGPALLHGWRVGQLAAGSNGDQC